MNETTNESWIEVFDEIMNETVNVRESRRKILNRRLELFAELSEEEKSELVELSYSMNRVCISLITNLIHVVQLKPLLR